MISSSSSCPPSPLHLKQVTLPSLLAQGAESFCWITAGVVNMYRMCSLTIECVLLLHGYGELLLDHRWCSKHVQNVFSYCRMCSLTVRHSEIGTAEIGTILIRASGVPEK